MSLANYYRALLFLALTWSSSSAAKGQPWLVPNVDGFVTSVGSSGFYMGNLLVNVSTRTTCAINQQYGSSPLSYYANYALGKPLFDTSDTVPVSCAALRVNVGDRIQISGSLPVKDNNITASRVVLYRSNQVASASGAALIQETPLLRWTGSACSGSVQIDGYPLGVTAKTVMIAAPSNTTLEQNIRNGDVKVVSKAHSSVPEQPDASCLLQVNTWAAYETRELKNGRHSASKITYWRNKMSEEELRYSREYGGKLVADDKGGIESVQLHDGKLLRVLPQRSIQNFVSQVGVSVIPAGQQNDRQSGSSKEAFRFLVVHSFHAPYGSGLIDINGVLPIIGGDGGGDEYHNPAFHSRVRDVIALPDGTILIPDQVLTSLKNEAQLAALLSYAVTSVVQRDAWFAQHHANGLGFVALWLRLNEQVLRLGIRQMFVAGYDIREAPFSWAIARKRVVANPLINVVDPDARIPWYTSYAFNYISQYYAGVDYSKLKRGEAEYQHFLQHLREVDPEAFTDAASK